MLRKQPQPATRGRPVRRDEVPFRDLQDVLDWHMTQVERFQRLADSRNVKGFRAERMKLAADLSQRDFHRRIVDVLEAELDGRQEARVAVSELQRR